MNLDRQQRAFSQLREAAEGDVHLVERALIAATQDVGGSPPTLSAVKKKIAELKFRPERDLA